MRRALSFLLLFHLVMGAVSAFAETIIVFDEPCTAELPDDLYDKPWCVDYELNSALIAAVEGGDASALALLERRYRVTEQYQERHRIAAVLLRRLANDTAIWNELYANAELALRFAADETDEPFQQWCDEHDFYSVLHRSVLYDALAIASTDPRSRPLLVKALAVDNRDVVYAAICGLSMQRDLTSLADIDEALARYPDAQYAAAMLSEFQDERADAIMKKYVVEEEPGAEEAGEEEAGEDLGEDQDLEEGEDEEELPPTASPPRAS